jgi:hypothetical protein
MIALLMNFFKCFSRKIAFKRLVGFILAHILSYNKKTITGVYRFLGCSDNLSNYHRFLSRSPWNVEKLFEALFKLIMKTSFVLQEDEDKKRLILIVDSTVIKKSGEKTEGLDKYYSSTLQKQQKGNEVVRLSLVLKIPGIGIVEFPFMCRLYVTEKSIKKFNLRLEYFTREVIGVLMVEKVRSWTDIPILLIGDALYSTETTINPLRKLKDVHLISRRRNGEKKGGVCWEMPRKGGRRGKGRPRKRGKEIRFNEIPQEEFTPCKFTKRGREHTAMAKRLDRVLIRRCKEPVTIVVVMDEKNKRYVLVCTDTSLETREIIELYRLRFHIEFGFRDTKQYTGFGDYQVRKIDSITKHLAISQTAYSLCKMLYVLCPGMRERSKAVFYLHDYGKGNIFSMMSLKEELRADFFAEILGKSGKRPDYLHLIFQNNRFLTGNHEKIPLISTGEDKIVA